MTQHDKLLNLLRGRDWVPLYEILHLDIAQYGRVINDLRKKKYIIENRFVGVVDGKKHTEFKLTYEPPRQSTAPIIKPLQLTGFGVVGKVTNSELIA